MAQEERIPRSTKKESLIYTPLQVKVLPKVTKCYNEAHHGNVVTSIFFMISVFLGGGVSWTSWGTRFQVGMTGADQRRYLRPGKSSHKCIIPVLCT